MSLFSIICPFELSNQAFVTRMSISLRIPVPCACFLTYTEQYANIGLIFCSQMLPMLPGLRIHITIWLIAYSTWQLGLAYTIQQSCRLSQLLKKTLLAWET